MTIHNVFITLLPDPDDYATPENREWQEECEELYFDIKDKIPPDQATIRPTRKEGSEDTRGADIFSVLIAGVASIGGFKTIYDIVKLWVDNRNQNRERVSVKIKIGDNEINISNISKDYAIALCEKYMKEEEKAIII